MRRVAIVEPRSSGWWLIDRAAQLGHSVVVVAGTTDTPGAAAHLRQAERVVMVDLDDDREIAGAIARLHDEKSFDAVIAGFETQVESCARIATQLGLPALRPEVASRLRDKALMRAAVAAAGLDQPAYVEVSGARTVSTAVADVGLPCVVKPTRLSGSRHVRKARTPAEAQAAVQAIRADPAPDVAAGPILVEEYISGPEFSVEGFVDDGAVSIVAVTAKMLGPEPYFVETGHVVPAPLDIAAARPITDYVVSVVLALGVSIGPFHAEVRLGERGPLLMEVAGRLPGDEIPRLVQLTCGFDLCAAMVRAYVGEPVSARPLTFHTVAGIGYFLRPGLERYRGVTVEPEARRLMHELNLLLPPDAPLTSVTSSRSRLGYAITLARTHDAVLRHLAVIDAGTKFFD